MSSIHSTARLAVALLLLACGSAVAARLSGVVQDDSGRPVPGALVVATSETNVEGAHGATRRWIASSDAAGRFAFDEFPEGACHVTANAGAGRVGLATSPCAVRAGDATLETAVVVGAQAGHVAGHVRHAPQDPASADDLVLLARVPIGDDPALAVLAARLDHDRWALDLPPGTWIVKAVTADGESRPSQVVVPGQAALIELNVAPTHLSHPEIARELHAMAVKDQDVRNELIAKGKFDPAAFAPAARVDRANLARLKQIIRRHGWPDAALVGNDGMGDLWLLAQHAPPDFIAQALPRLKAAADRGEIAWSSMALMIDRDLMDRGQPQIYGSQWQGTGADLAMYATLDPEHLDQRRAQVGLGPIADYKALIEKDYRKPASAK